MYKRLTGLVSMPESPEMNEPLSLDPRNNWISLSKLVPWFDFDRKHQKNFQNKKLRAAIDWRTAFGAVLIKPA